MGAGEYGSMDDLVNTKALDQNFTGGGPKAGFMFTTTVILRSPTSYAAYDCYATPVATAGPLATATRRYYTNETGVIYEAPAATTISADSVTRIITGGTPLNN